MSGALKARGKSRWCKKMHDLSGKDGERERERERKREKKKKKREKEGERQTDRQGKR